MTEERDKLLKKITEKSKENDDESLEDNIKLSFGVLGFQDLFEYIDGQFYIRAVITKYGEETTQKISIPLLLEVIRFLGLGVTTITKGPNAAKEQLITLQTHPEDMIELLDREIQKMADDLAIQKFIDDCRRERELQFHSLDPYTLVIGMNESEDSLMKSPIFRANIDIEEGETEE